LGTMPTHGLGQTQRKRGRQSPGLGVCGFGRDRLRFGSRRGGRARKVTGRVGGSKNRFFFFSVFASKIFFPSFFFPLLLSSGCHSPGRYASPSPSPSLFAFRQLGGGERPADV
jgi:hypothetical protein